MEDSAPPSRPPRQLPLDLPLAPNFRREDFLAAPCNRAALAMIDQWPEWHDRALLLIGPPGSGKSHLCAIFAARAGALAASAAVLPTLAELAAARPTAMVVDGLAPGLDETALFHLLNFATESRAFLMMSARRAPGLDEFRLPDLLSRLRRATSLEIGAPDESLMRAVLEKLFKDRQLVVDAGLLDYAALRLERSLGAAQAFAQELDREALAQGRRPTRALAREVLERFGAA